MNTNLIYGLRDPRNDVYYYIGKTTVGNKRPLNHLIKSHNITINEWVSNLEDIGIVPFVDIIEKDILLENLAEREKYWIGYYYELNSDLFNVQLLPHAINKIKTQEDDDTFNTLTKSLFNIGDILKNERLSRNISQNELAIKVGISRITLSSCESGKKNSTLGTIKKYIIALNKIDIVTRNLSSRNPRKSRL